MSYNSPVPGGEFLLYQTEDGHTRVECRLVADQSLWLSQAAMAELFQTSKQNIAKTGSARRAGTQRRILACARSAVVGRCRRTGSWGSLRGLGRCGGRAGAGS